MTLKPVHIQMTLPFAVGDVDFIANEAQQRTAWKLYVEFETRVVTQLLKNDEGLVREALTSLYNLFQITREILRDAGPEIADGPHSLGPITIKMLNEGVRPITAKWHPLLKDHEEKRPAHKTPTEHEHDWEHNARARKELEQLQTDMSTFVTMLARMVGAL